MIKQSRARQGIREKWVFFCTRTVDRKEMELIVLAQGQFTYTYTSTSMGDDALELSSRTEEHGTWI